MQDLKNKLQDAVKQAMRTQEKLRLGILRMILAAIKQQEVDQRIQLTDEHIIKILIKMIKQRKDSILHFKSANRDDLVLQEQFEIDTINEFLPQQLSESEIRTAVIDAITIVGANSIKDMGKVMQYLHQNLLASVDFEQVGSIVKGLLNVNGHQ